MWTIIGWVVCVLLFIGGVAILFEGDLGGAAFGIIASLAIWYFFLRTPAAPPQPKAANPGYQPPAQSQTQTYPAYKPRRDEIQLEEIKRPVIRIKI